MKISSGFVWKLVFLGLLTVLADVQSCYACAGPQKDCVLNNRTDFLQMDCTTFKVEGMSLIHRSSQPDILEKFDSTVGSRNENTDVGCLTLTFKNSVRGLRDVRIIVPSAVVRGEDATLHCYYDLEGEQLYAVKWYWYTTEFYRYTPNEKPPIKQFPTQTGLTVRETESNDTSVVLEHVPRSVSGRYSCEVSADAPSFYTLIQNANLQVVDLPKKDPYISINRKRYHYGDILKATCTSEHSNPAVNLTWYVNGFPADARHVNNTKEVAHNGQYYTAHSVLRMKITKQSFERHRLKIRCVASMYDVYYKSNEKSVEFEKRRHPHYSITTTESPMQWELIEPSVLNPEVRFVYNSSAGGGLISAPKIALLTALSVILFR